MSILVVSLADVGRANAPRDSPHMWGGWAERVADQGGHQRPEYTHYVKLSKTKTVVLKGSGCV